MNMRRPMSLWTKLLALGLFLLPSAGSLLAQPELLDDVIATVGGELVLPSLRLITGRVWMRLRRSLEWTSKTNSSPNA